MTVDEFFSKYNGKGIDFDGAYGFQCMDVYQQYNREVVKGPHIPANAYQVWNRYPTDLYQRILNTPENYPQKGDVVIWNQNTGGGFGHIAICSDARLNDFNSMDQNWPAGSICHYQSHNYNHVIGWLRPNLQPDIVVDDMPPYLKGLFQENNLDVNNESQIRDFFQKAKDLPGKEQDLRAAQERLNDVSVSLDQAQRDLLACRATPQAPVETPKTDEEKTNIVFSFLGGLLRFLLRK